MSVLDKFLDAIRLNDDYEEEDADSDSFFDEEDDDIERKTKVNVSSVNWRTRMRTKRKSCRRNRFTLHRVNSRRQRPPLQARLLLHELQSQLPRFLESYSNEKESRCIKYGSMRHQTGFHGGYP